MNYTTSFNKFHRFFLCIVKMQSIKIKIIKIFYRKIVKTAKLLLIVKLHSFERSCCMVILSQEQRNITIGGIYIK